MKSKIFMMILGITLSLILIGCGSFNPISILKSDSTVREFLDEHPNADITFVQLKNSQVASENIKVQEMCGISLENKTHYKVMMIDSESNLELYGYIDYETQEIICIKKIGKKEVSTKEEIIIIEEENNTQEKDSKEETKKEETKEETNDNIDSTCDTPVTLEGEIVGDKIKLKWSEYACDDFKGYKVVWSDTIKNPKYPENGYVKYITNIETNSYEYEIKKETNYFAITTLTDNGKEYSNSIKIESTIIEEKEEDIDECESDIELKAEINENKANLEWDKYDCNNFQGYKVVWSQTVENPKYPENGYLKYITDKSSTSYSHELKKGNNYYAITILTKDGKEYSNTVKLAYEINITETNETEINETEDNDTEEIVKVFYEDYEITLNETYLEDNTLVLHWNPYTGEDLNYYKVVWSDSNEELQYPEDGYIKVISEKEISNYEVPKDKIVNGTNYFRITAIFDGFYDGEDKSERVNSNVLSIES